MFGYILQFESFTGGGGDADEDSHGTRIEAARKGGIQVGNLTAKALTKWNSLGWYMLFNSRCVPLIYHIPQLLTLKCDSHGKSPKVTCPVVYNSAWPLSDIDSDLAGVDTDTDGDDSDTSPVKTTSSLKRKTLKEASRVLEPKYKPAPNKTRQQNLASASGLTEYLKSKAELDKARFDGMKLRQKIELVKGMLADPTTSPELWEAAQAVLLKVLQD